MGALFSPPPESARTSTGLLFLRVVFGLAFMLHGLTKAEHPFTWSAHLVPYLPGWLQLLVVVAELGGGLFLLLGLLTPLAALMILADMVGAFLTSTMPRGGTTFVSDRPGTTSYEKNLVYFAVAFLLLLAGPGRYSVDAFLFGRQRVR